MKIVNCFYFLWLCLLLLTGCWDTVDIEERGFIIGSAIDLGDGSNDEHPQFLLTNQMVLPGALSASQGTGEGQNVFINFTTISDSIYKANEDIVSRSSKRPFYEHLTVLAVSEEVAKQEKLLINLLDTYIRDVDLRRGVKIIITKGPAKELLTFTTSENKLPALHIDKILDQGSEQTGLMTPKTTGDLEEYHLTGNSYVLPYLEVTDVVEQKQGAVFHGRQEKMVGLFNEEEMQGHELIIGKQQVNIIEFPYKEKSSTLKVIRLHSKVTVDPANLEEIKANIEIEFEGTIKESFVQKDLTTKSEIEDVQKALAHEVEKMIRQALDKGQGEYGTDVFDIWREMKKKHYDTWVKVRDDWEEGEYYFNNVTFEIDVTPQIYSIGTTNKTN